MYVQQFPKGAKYQVSREPANAPLWSRDGKELFYYQIDTGKLVTVRVQTEPSFSVGEPSVVPIDRMIQGGTETRQYDVMPDGRFVILTPAPELVASEPRPTQQIHVVLNWFDELKQRVPTKP